MTKNLFTILIASMAATASFAGVDAVYEPKLPSVTVTITVPCDEALPATTTTESAIISAVEDVTPLNIEEVAPIVVQEAAPTVIEDVTPVVVEVEAPIATPASTDIAASILTSVISFAQDPQTQPNLDRYLGALLTGDKQTSHQFERDFKAQKNEVLGKLGFKRKRKGK